MKFGNPLQNLFSSFSLLVPDRSGASALRCVISGVVLSCALALSPLYAGAQESPSLTPLSLETSEARDDAIEARLRNIYDELGGLERVSVDVRQGVVTLEGPSPGSGPGEEALEIARRLEGVVAVRDRTTSNVDVSENVSPFLERLIRMAQAAVRALPLLLVAAVLFFMVAMAGWWLAGRRSLWRRVSPNPFIADLAAQAVRVVALLLAFVLALNLAGASALLGTVLGGAGVIGLAIGIAVRDSLENYISSIMLSLRQPFRANDHVVIDDAEGKVIRLTSRATILMTLDGNHLRIPNAVVFKATILNYTRNPERRFNFGLGVDAADDPQRAIDTGMHALGGLDFVLASPEPRGAIETVGDSNIVLTFHAWINQTQADFQMARSTAIRATKMALEKEGFTLPEPIYRLRFDGGGERSPTRFAPPDTPRQTNAVELAGSKEAGARASSISPQTDLDRRIEKERAEDDTEDLLNSSRPIE